PGLVFCCAIVSSSPKPWTDYPSFRMGSNSAAPQACRRDNNSSENAMTASIIDGKLFAEGLRGRIAGHVARLKAEHGITPGLAVVIVGHDPGSQVYVDQKDKQTVEVGMHSEKYELPGTVSDAE